MKNSTIISVAVALLVGVIIGYMSTHQDASVMTISPAGTTGTSGKYYSKAISLTDASGTTTSMFNNSGQDFAVRATDVMCQGLGTSLTAYTGTGLAGLTFSFATSSTNTVTGNVAQINTNYSAVINVSTSTVNSYQATSTEGVITGTTRVWPSGTYMIASANATNTAACALGISVMPL